ncbi:MAG TPA: hypothetical protein VGK36_01875, partial [Candidatus Angelobacter sp.]
ILCSATFTILQGILDLSQRPFCFPSRYRRSVKDVPEHFVKDVMKPYTFMPAPPRSGQGFGG